MKKNNSSDVLILSFIRILTLVVGILTTSILSHSLPLLKYGTYSAGMTVLNTAFSITVLGFVDASNYFYNGREKREEYLNTLFALQIILGILCAITLLCLKNIIIDLFNNEAIREIYPYMIFRPLFYCLADDLLTLQMSIGKARSVAIRNIFFSSIRLLAVCYTAFRTQDIRTVFAALLLLDILTVTYYLYNFSKCAFFIRPWKFCANLVNPILKFAFPMGAYLLTCELMINLDKYLIGAKETTERMAIYANCSTKLPFSIISSAFLTITLPLITRFVKSGNYKDALDIFKSYLKIGYITHCTFCVACILLSKEVITILYGQQYVEGCNVFIIYTLIQLLSFATVTAIFTAFSKTKQLFQISFCLLGANFILNFVFYYIFGFIGPALATALITLILGYLLLTNGARMMGVKIHNLFEFRKMLLFLMETGIFCFAALVLKSFLNQAGCPLFITFLIVGLFFTIGVLFFQKNEIKNAMSVINKYKLTSPEK